MPNPFRTFLHTLRSMFAPKKDWRCGKVFHIGCDLYFFVLRRRKTFGQYVGLGYLEDGFCLGYWIVDNDKITPDNLIEWVPPIDIGDD